MVTTRRRRAAARRRLSALALALAEGNGLSGPARATAGFAPDVAREKDAAAAARKGARLPAYELTQTQPNN